MAAVALVAVGFSAAQLTGGDGGRDADVEIALAGTDLAPGASADARLIDTDAGVVVLLDVRDLPPAPEGFYYQGWVRNADEGVTIGTFHMRGGDNEIELWSGVPLEDYPVITVTLQREGDGPASSGDVVLRGEIA